MKIDPINQLNLYGLENNLKFLIALYREDKLPNKLLLTGQKGIGKCTLAYHLINFILSQKEEFQYNENNYEIYTQNKSYKLILNGTNPNFQLIDVSTNSQNIKIDQIRLTI